MMNDQNLNCAVTDVSLHDECKKGFVGYLELAIDILYCAFTHKLKVKFCIKIVFLFYTKRKKAVKFESLCLGERKA